MWFLSGESYDVEVYNKTCKNKYLHFRVPVEHVRLLEDDSNLYVKRIKRHYSSPGFFEDKKKDNTGK